VDNLVSPSQNLASPLTKSKSKDSTDLAAKATPVKQGATAAKFENQTQVDGELAQRLDKHSLEAIVEAKICRFLDQIGSYYPEDLHSLIMKKVEKPLLGQILRRTGGNQVHASKILGINRNTLRKKMKLYGFSP
jgi:Fis family transcriptional regulator